jgi:hypothetical protein
VVLQVMRNFLMKLNLHLRLGDPQEAYAHYDAVFPSLSDSAVLVFSLTECFQP